MADEATEKLTDINRILQSAYAQLRGAEANKALQAYTLDHAIQEQVDRLKPSNTATVQPVRYATSVSVSERLTRYERIESLQSDLQKVIKQIKDADTNAGTGG